MRKIIMFALMGAASFGVIGSASAAVVFQSDPNHTNANGNGFPDGRGAGSTAVGRLTVSANTAITGIGVLNYLPTLANLKFFIANASTGQMLYMSTAKSFAADTGAIDNDHLTYKLSDTFAFTFLTGTTYAVGSIADATTYTFADFNQTNTSGPFTSLLGNVNVNNFANPVLNTGQNCCSIGFELLQADSAVPEPASWAMMVGGFGMIGGALRHRRRATVSFA